MTFGDLSGSAWTYFRFENESRILDGTGVPKSGKLNGYLLRNSCFMNVHAKRSLFRKTSRRRKVIEKKYYLHKTAFFNDFHAILVLKECFV